MTDFMRVKNENPKLKQSEMANRLNYSSSTSQRYRNDKNMLSPYRIQPNNTNKRSKKASNTNSDNNSHREPNVERPQITSNDLKTTSNETVKNKKNKLKGGAKIEINEHYLDESLHNNNSLMKLTMQIISKDKTIRSNTVIDLKEFNNQPLATLAKKGEQVVRLMPAIKKDFDLIGDDKVELYTENDALKNKIVIMMKDGNKNLKSNC